jgi:hypothetical protein
VQRLDTSCGSRTCFRSGLLGSSFSKVCLIFPFDITGWHPTQLYLSRPMDGLIGFELSFWCPAQPPGWSHMSRLVLKWDICFLKGWMFPFDIIGHTQPNLPPGLIVLIVFEPALDVLICSCKKSLVMSIMSRLALKWFCSQKLLLSIDIGWHPNPTFNFQALWTVCSSELSFWCSYKVAKFGYVHYV